MSTSTPADDIIRRIRAEYTEMPGLRLTESQAQRLWGLDAQTCRQALTYLTDTRFLVHTGSGLYARASTGPTVFPAPRMAKAALERRRAVS
jgi:hypothetical protein